MPEPTFGAPVAQDPSNIAEPGALVPQPAPDINAPVALTTVPAQGLKPLEELPSGNEE
ncbi:hypothetical protein N22_022 [Idiomarinaceae phage 1N2-2]|uniref:hypothetical protein n=1 Tax=Idiomarinaceae phage 1N2-2 TaxID=1536592 RepID=UPI0004F59B68|nr:hypothetical protein N22_022 [Idiomarinaceae phage 1N2-2]AIM40724.1 hypothetical protein N22_022 [Idiomarinaceae phage 1N2-2]